MCLKLRFVVDSIPSALTILFNDLPQICPHGSTFDAVLKIRVLARIGSKRTAHLRHTYCRAHDLSRYHRRNVLGRLHACSIAARD
jgi:hypothetical protein